jgi:hypothetical protein
MLIAKEAPFEKLTPAACRTAFPLKLRAPDGSLLFSKDGSKMIKQKKEGKEHTQSLKSWKMGNQNFPAMEVCAFVRGVVGKGDPRQDLPQVDHRLDEKEKDLEEWKDLYHGERKMVVVF